MDVRAVTLDGAHRQAQLLGDLRVGIAERDHPQHLNLALEETVRGARRLDRDTRPQPRIQVRVAGGSTANRLNPLRLSRLLEDVAKRPELSASRA
jgi:hypothetical protein